MNPDPEQDSDFWLHPDSMNMDPKHCFLEPLHADLHMDVCNCNKKDFDKKLISKNFSYGRYSSTYS